MNPNYILLLLVLCIPLANFTCISGKDETEYVEKLAQLIGPSDAPPLRLPRRLLGDVYLKKGMVYGMDTLHISNRPVRLICYNDTLGVIQPKMTIDNVTFVYKWVFGDDESWGTAKIPSQKVYIDIDIEQSSDSRKPVMLGLYITKITNTKFDVDIEGYKNSSSKTDYKFQVSLVTRTFISRDAGLAITMDVSPKITDYLFYNRLPIE